MSSPTSYPSTDSKYMFKIVLKPFGSILVILLLIVIIYNEHREKNALIKIPIRVIICLPQEYMVCVVKKLFCFKRKVVVMGGEGV